MYDLLSFIFDNGLLVVLIGLSIALMLWGVRRMRYLKGAAPCCPRCRYELEGLAKNFPLRCPECGYGIPDEHSTRLQRGHWLTVALGAVAMVLAVVVLEPYITFGVEQEPSCLLVQRRLDSNGTTRSMIDDELRQRHARGELSPRIRERLQDQALAMLQNIIMTSVPDNPDDWSRTMKGELAWAVAGTTPDSEKDCVLKWLKSSVVGEQSLGIEGLRWYRAAHPRPQRLPESWIKAYEAVLAQNLHGGLDVTPFVGGPGQSIVATPAMVSTLLDRAKDSTQGTYVRRLALGSLEEIAASKEFDSATLALGLEPLLRDSSVLIQAETLQCFAVIGPAASSALPMIRELRTSPDGNVVSWARRAEQAISTQAP